MQANQQHTPLLMTNIGDHETWYRAHVANHDIHPHDRFCSKDCCSHRVTVLEQWARGKEQLWGRLTQENAQLFADTAPIGAMMDMIKRMVEDIEQLTDRIRLLERLATP